jgi:Domain of unknown function (DUF4349)
MAAVQLNRGWGPRVVAAILLGALALGACAGSDDAETTGGGGGDAAIGAQHEPASRAADEASLEDSGGGGGSAVPAALEGATIPAAGPRVIKRAHLGIEVPRNEFQAAVGDASSIAGEHGGYVLSTQVTDTEEGFGTVVLRVPANEFEAALAAIRDDLGEVKSDRVSGQDVSEEFVDLEARLRNFTAQEAVLLRLMNRAQTVVATIRVQRELTDIQLEIERIRGRLRWLRDQTDFSTITVDFNEAGAVVAKTSTLEKAWENAWSVFLAIVSGVIVSAGALLPVALLALVALIIFRLVRPRFQSET